MADDRRYARLSRRLQASCLDFAFSFYTPFAAIGLVTWFAGPLSGPLVVLLALTPLVLEPILVARSGATLGHWLFGLRVVELETGRPPRLGVSFERYMIKGACLGPWLSPLIAITARHQGLHDLACGTVVEVIDPSSRRGRLAAYDPAFDAIRPTLSARVVSTVGFSLVLFLAIVTAGLLMWVSCGNDFECGTVGNVFFDVVLRLWFVLQYAVLWLGPAGRLPGVRA